MAMCAISGYRIKHGTNSAATLHTNDIDLEDYLERALAATQSLSATPHDLEYLQALVLISATALEIGNAFIIQRYLGLHQ